MGVRPWGAANKDIPDWHCPSAFPAWAATYDMTPTCEVAVVGAGTGGQGLTLVRFSAQLEPCLTPENTLHTP
jgi:hypothetical protein